MRILGVFHPSGDPASRAYEDDSQLTSGVIGQLSFRSLVSVVARAGRRGRGAEPVVRASPRIGFMGPITGDAAFIGKEQLGFSRYAIRTLGGGTIKLVDGDTRFDPARASTVAATFHANPDILAVVGPARSREVLAVAPVFMKADRLPFISGSAIGRSLTNGSIPNFFRVVPNDSVQSRTIATYIRQGLKAKDVFVVDDRSAYSKAAREGRAVEAAWRAASRSPAPRSARRRRTSRPLVAKIGSEIDVVFLPWQIAASAQVFGQQLRQQGAKAIIVGSDGLDSGDFTIPGSYVSAFAPDIRAIAGNAAFIEGYGASVRLQLRPADVRGDPGRDRGDQEGMRGRRRHPRRGAGEPEGDVHPEDRPRRQPSIHRSR